MKPGIAWYDAALPGNLPEGVISNPGTLLAIQFCLMHFVEVRRWQDMRKFGSVNDDPIFTNNKVPNLEMGYPGGIFDPLNFAKGDSHSLKVKEVRKNDTDRCYIYNMKLDEIP